MTTKSIAHDAGMFLPFKFSDKFDVKGNVALEKVRTPLKDTSFRFYVLNVKEAKEKSLKDKLFLSALEKISSAGLLRSTGSIRPTKEVIVVNGMMISPCTADPYVAATSWVGSTAKKGSGSAFYRKGRGDHLNGCMADIAWTPTVGDELKHSIYDTQQLIVEKAKTIDPDLHWFENEELYKYPLGRGLYFPVMKVARLTFYQSQFYGKQVLPQFVFPALEPFEMIENMRDIEIPRADANVGFKELVPLSSPGVPYTQSNLYWTLLKGSEDMAAYMATKRLPLSELTGLLPPHAVGSRFQSYGRAIIMVSKKPIFFIESTWGQPLTSALERGAKWYACGDRLHRLQQAKMLLDGVIDYLVDGDDFVLRIARKLVMGDYSAYESSIRWSDYLSFMAWLIPLLNSSYSRRELDALVYNAYAGQTALAFVDGFGIFHRELGHGVNSGAPTTHTLESVINAACLEGCVDLESLNQAFNLLTKLGRIIKPTSQYVSKTGHVILSKLFSDGREIYGSSVRALWGLAASEGPWEVPPNMTMSEWLDARNVSILANVVRNPTYNIVLDSLLSTGYERRTSKTRLTVLALELAAKRRGEKKGSTILSETGVIERKCIAKVLADLG